MPGAKQVTVWWHQSAGPGTCSRMYSDALCHVFNAGIGRHTETGNKEREIIADAPFAGGKFCANIDQSIQEQHWLTMQNERRRWHAGEWFQIFGGEFCSHSIGRLLELAQPFEDVVDEQLR